MNENPEKERDWLPGHRPQAPGDKLASAFSGYALLFSLAGAGLAWLAEADYVWGIIPPFIGKTALIGLALVPLAPAGLCWLSLRRSGRWPKLSDTLIGTLILAGGMPVFTVGFVAVSNSWLDRSEGVMQPVTVTRRWDRRHGEGYRRSKTPELHDAYVYLAPLDPAGGELRVPGDYASTRGLKAGDSYGLLRKKGFWGLPHVAIKTR